MIDEEADRIRAEGYARGMAAGLEAARRPLESYAARILALEELVRHIASTVVLPTVIRAKAEALFSSEPA